MQKRIDSKVIYVFISLILLVIILSSSQLFILNGLELLTHNPRAMDFIAFYTGGELILNNPGDLYNLYTQKQIQEQIAPITSSLNIFLPFLNPPFVALFYSLFAKLPLLAAYCLSVLGNIIVLIVLYLIAIKQLFWLNWQKKILIICCIIFYIPVLTSLLISQLSIIMTLVFLISWHLLKKGATFQAGVLLSLLLIKPHFFLLPFILFVIQRQWKTVLGIIAGSTLLFGISALVVGWDGIVQYFLLLISAASWNSGYGIDIQAQHSLQTFLLVATQTNNLSEIRVIWIVCLLVIIIPTLYMWTKHYLFSSSQFALQFVLLILTTLITTPHTHFHDLTLLIVVGIIVEYIKGKQKLPLQNILSIFLIFGFLIALFGYLATVFIGSYSQQIWIIISVGYLMTFWGFILYYLHYLMPLKK